MGNHVYQYKKRSDTNTMSDLRKYYGGDEGIRTPGLCLAKAALSQLSYIPRRACAGAIVAICRGHVNVKVRELRKSITGHRLAGDAAATVSYVLAAKTRLPARKWRPSGGLRRNHVRDAFSGVKCAPE